MKCKKTTRFVDDVHMVSPSCNVVVTGDSASRLTPRNGEGASCTLVSPRVDILTSDKPEMEEEPKSIMGQGSKRSGSLRTRITINNNVPLHTVPVPRLRETDFPADTDTAVDATSEGAVLDANEIAISRISICSETASAVQVMPEVETDRPQPSSLSSSHCPAEVGKFGSGRARSLSLSCSSLDKKAGSESGNESSGEKERAGEEVRSLRRHSYELAYKHGRISPGLFDETH